jgi:polyisoprenoid-binding protein YceI
LHPSDRDRLKIPLDPIAASTGREARFGAWPFLMLALAITSSASYCLTVAATPRTGQPAPAQFVVSVDPARSTLHWTLDTTLHLVHGTFAVKRGEVTVDPVTGNATGEIVADATSGKTDNDSRDKKMHQEFLETARFPEIVFRITQIEGLAVPLNKAQVKLHGTFLIHGTQHDMIVPADAEFADDHWNGTSKFVVPYIAWGIRNPSNFLLKASPTADVTLELSGSLHQVAKAP